MEKVHEPTNEEVLGRIKSFCLTSFYENVASSPMMDRFYKVAIDLSKVMRRVETSEGPITIVDMGGGSGRIYDMMIKDMKKGLKEKVNYIPVDISRGQLGIDGRKKRVVGDIMHLPLVDSSAHAVFLLNPPSSVGVIETYIERTKPASIAQMEENNRVHMFLQITSGEVDLLNVLEGARVLRDDGIFVEGMPFRKGQTNNVERILKGVRDSSMRNGVSIGPIPLEMKEHRIIELDPGVMSLWAKYGVDVDWEKFQIESYIKTGAKLDDWFKTVRKTLNFSLSGLSKTDRFWEIVEEMERAKQKEN